MTGPTVIATEVVIDLAGLAQNWWTFLLRGVLAFVLAAFVWFMPVGAVVAFAIVFGAFAFADGVFSVIAGIRKIQKGKRWSWLILAGLAGIVTGAVVVIYPLLAAVVFSVFLWSMIAFWSVSTGVAMLLAAMHLRHVMKGELMLGAAGLLSIFLGAVVVWFVLTNPAGGVLALGWLLGAYAFLFGLMMILLGLKLRQLHRTL
ncbi:HdeD family acid-resistance protein [Hyphococcus sp.]|uniref:HdeD family acid-resistance protein n=1 Tax=Hyphococcus sp. TaxID=2038636 RepID=UPI003D0A573E